MSDKPPPALTKAESEALIDDLVLWFRDKKIHPLNSVPIMAYVMVLACTGIARERDKDIHELCNMIELASKMVLDAAKDIFERADKASKETLQ